MKKLYFVRTIILTGSLLLQLNTRLRYVFVFTLWLATAVAACAQGTSFTYQGRLGDNGSPANGNYDLQFYLRDAPTSGNPVGTTNTIAPVPVSNGLFAVTLDFGAGVFTGAPRWLEIGVRTNGSVADHFTLSPRQALTPSPYAIYAGTASNVANGSVVKSLNNLNDNVTLAAGANVTITTNGNTLTLAATGTGGSNLWNLNGADTYYNAGNVGIGTATPASKLTVFGSSYGLEHNNGTVRLGTYVDSSGGWLGTLSNHKLTFFANNNGLPNMTMTLDTAGGVGIGTDSPTPGYRLEVNGSTLMRPANGTVQFGSPNAELGMSILPTAGNRADLRFDGATLKLAAGPGIVPPSDLNGLTINTNGNVGIGMASPLIASQWKLEVNGPARVTAGGSGGAVHFSAPNGESGMGIIGANRADLRFDGSTVKLLAGVGTGPPAPGNGIAVTTAGNVGIGTTTPGAKLHAETSLANTAAVYGNATGAGGVGVYGQSAAGAAVYADGNAVQPRDKGGFVKAMAFIDPFRPADQYVVRCYNSQQAGNATSTAPCGITVTRSLVGGYTIDFGFKVADRFISVTPATPYGRALSAVAVVSGNNSIGVVMKGSDGDFDYVDSAFHIIVY